MPTSLDQVIDYTKLFQDIELATAIQQLKQNPSDLTNFVQSQQDKVFKNITDQKHNTFEKVYGDLNKAKQVQEAILMYDTRSKQLSDLNDQIYANQKNSADAVTEDKNMAGRKSEMNEWSVNNKKDTLFVFSSLFIMLSGLLLITVLWRMGMISSYLWGALATPLIIIFVLILLNRSQYTDNLRNKRYWNKQIFEGKYGKIPIPMCAQELVAGIESGKKKLSQGVQNIAKNTTQGVAKGVANFAQEAANFAQSAAQGMA